MIRTRTTDIPTDPDERVELLITRILRIGVGLSMAILILGVAAVFVQAPPDLYSRQALPPLIKPGAGFPHTAGAIARQFDHLYPPAVIAVGLLVLIATPIVRVAVSLVGFAIRGDHQYTLLTAIVLAILLLSMFLGETG